MEELLSESPRGKNHFTPLSASPLVNSDYFGHIAFRIPPLLGSAEVLPTARFHAVP